MATDPQFRIVHRAPILSDSAWEASGVAPDLVLVVDDEPEIRMLVSGWLEAAGYRVRTATHAEEAVQALQAPLPGLMVCDVALPGFDGFWLVDRVRHHSPFTAVVVMSGTHHPDDGTWGVQPGSAEFLQKPFGRIQLLGGGHASHPGPACAQPVGGPPVVGKAGRT